MGESEGGVRGVWVSEVCVGESGVSVCVNEVRVRVKVCVKCV